MHVCLRFLSLELRSTPVQYMPIHFFYSQMVHVLLVVYLYVQRKTRGAHHVSLFLFYLLHTHVQGHAARICLKLLLLQHDSISNSLAVEGKKPTWRGDC